jgi:preprotein translocase subunit YajC
MMFNLLAETTTGATQWYMYVGFGVLIIGMLAMTIIPQRKQKKKMEQMMNSIAVGDKIMTIGGFVGTIVEINEESGRYTINVGSEETPVNVVIVKNAIRSKL